MVHLLGSVDPRRGRQFKAATAAKRYKSVQQFFRWLVEEGEVKRSPMERMKPPAIPEEPPTVISQEQLKKLLRSCEGRDFYARRDTAIINQWC